MKERFAITAWARKYNIDARRFDWLLSLNNDILDAEYLNELVPSARPKLQFCHYESDPIALGPHGRDSRTSLDRRSQTGTQSGSAKLSGREPAAVVSFGEWFAGRL